MTAQQAIKEIQRQIEELEREAAKQIPPALTKQINDSVSVMRKMIDLVKKVSGPSLENEIPPELERDIVNQNRQVEFLLKLTRNFHLIPRTPENPQDALVVYIELEGFELGMWGTLFERLIRDRIGSALQVEGLGKSSWGFAAENFCYFVLIVSDKVKAFPIVKAELENLGILRCCQLGHYDGAELRTLYSHGTLRPFQECVKRAHYLISKTLGNLPGNKPPRRF